MTSITVADLPEAVADIRAALATIDTNKAGSEAEIAELLRVLHGHLMRATRRAGEAPVDILELAAEVARAAPPAATDSLRARARVVYRLLRADSVAAAWEVLIDNATGVVDEDFGASRATRAVRSAPRLPLLTRVEAGTVYADLPGFRDPRYGAPDACYDITDLAELKAQLDEIEIGRSAIAFGGWAAYDVLTASTEERVELVLTGVNTRIALPCRRVHRVDMVAGHNEVLRRRAWAGWATELELHDPRLHAGEWLLSVAVDHEGLVGRSPIGRYVSDVARAVAASAQEVDGLHVGWNILRPQWALVLG